MLRDAAAPKAGRRMTGVALVAFGCGCLAACQTMHGAADSMGDTMQRAGNSAGWAVTRGWDWMWESDEPAAAAEVKPTAGQTVSGLVQFKQAGATVRVKVDLTGLAPHSVHGFHVHQRGDCSAPDAMSAGGHFNPEGVAHGHFKHVPHHSGDLPNLTADAKGEVHTWFDADYLTVGSGGTDVSGRSIVVHRDPDDYQSQPAGNAGPRLACGVIIEL